MCVSFSVLRFIYTDGEPPNMEALGRFLVAADRFALDSLKLECTHRLLSTVSVDSVVDMLRLAGTHSCADLCDSRYLQGRRTRPRQ